MNWNQLEVGKRYGFKRPMVFVPAEGNVPEQWSLSTPSESPDPETAAAGITLTAKRQIVYERHQATRQVQGKVWTIDGKPLSPSIDWISDDFLSGYWEVVEKEKERLVQEQREREEQKRLRDVAIAEIHKALALLGITSRKSSYGIEISWERECGGMANLDKLLVLVQQVAEVRRVPVS